MVGRFGYSFIGRVGRVNFADPAVTSTLLPSRVNKTGLFGRAREISASNLPGTNTRPFSLISAEKEDLADVSKSEALSVMSLFASITIPSNAVIIGRVERLRETQFTLSVRVALSTTNFITMSLTRL
jgi:hypothetical protein